LKSMPLKEYRILQFATHGLVAGDLNGLAEPALVLTPPAKATEEDDGLLTASEIAGLNLDADWVVLSACNTAAGNKVGADALSGLARAFFFAGARAMLVSHWSVYSQAAVELTTRTFRNLAKAPATGRAEAFRQAMLTLINEGRPPSYWAPFVVVGEGGPTRLKR
jgi:CHAT domain-containing protein